MTGQPRFSGRAVTLSPEQLRRSGVCLLASDTLADIPERADIPAQSYVERSPTGPLSTQLAVPGGLHTCDMTSMVNALIWQGWLTGEQGQSVHDNFRSHNAGREFTRQTIGGTSVLIGNTEEASIRAITGERIYNACRSQEGLNKETATRLVLGALSRNQVLTIGDGGHARLAVGYESGRDHTGIWVSNPYHPEDIASMPLQSVLEFTDNNVIHAIARKSESLGYRPDTPFPRV